jgi:hypothetical protein
MTPRIAYGRQRSESALVSRFPGITTDHPDFERVHELAGAGTGSSTRACHVVVDVACSLSGDRGRR